MAQGQLLGCETARVRIKARWPGQPCVGAWFGVATVLGEVRKEPWPLSDHGLWKGRCFGKEGVFNYLPLCLGLAKTTWPRHVLGGVGKAAGRPRGPEIRPLAAVLELAWQGTLRL